MKKYYLFLALLGFILLAGAKVKAQGTEPGLGLPLLDDGDSATPIASTVTYTQTPYTIYSTATAVAVSTATLTSQSAVDDAETGSEVFVLAILSVTGGVGIFLIKKYFDFKRYSL